MRTYVYQKIVTILRFNFYLQEIIVINQKTYGKMVLCQQYLFYLLTFITLKLVYKRAYTKLTCNLFSYL
jgi:hypothetical protein